MNPVHRHCWEGGGHPSIRPTRKVQRTYRPEIQLQNEERIKNE